MSMGITVQLHLHAAQRVPGPNPHHVSGRAYLHQGKRLRAEGSKMPMSLGGEGAALLRSDNKLLLHHASYNLRQYNITTRLSWRSTNQPLLDCRLKSPNSVLPKHPFGYIMGQHCQPDNHLVDATKSLMSAR